MNFIDKLLTTTFLVILISSFNSPALGELSNLSRNNEPRYKQPALGNTWRFEQKYSNDIQDYFFYKPQDAEMSDDKIPLVVVLHGAPGKSYAARYLSEPNYQRDFPSYILIPTAGRNETWISKSQESVMPGVVKLLDQLQEDNRNIDDKRIYIIGCSEGGNGVFGTALHYPNIFAAGVAISGRWNVKDAPKMNKMPLLVMNSANDTLIPPSFGRDIARISKENGGDTEYKEIKDMDHYCPYPSFYSRKTWDWMFSKIKG